MAKIKYQYNDIKKMFEEKGYLLLSTIDEFVKSRENLAYKCLKHENAGIKKISMYSFLRGRECFECSYENRKTTRWRSSTELKVELNKLGYDTCDDIKNTSTNLILIDIYGYKYNTSYNSIMNFKPMRFHVNNPYSLENIKKHLVIENIPYKLLTTDSYKGNSMLLDWVCNHNHYFQMNWNNFNQGNRCPTCNLSKGELKIKKIFDLNYIKYIQQYTNDACKNKRNLPFDFLLFNNYDRQILIEYDGEGHFESFRYSENKKKMNAKLMSTQKHDKIKNQYCIDNNIPLIRIPYWEQKNIEYILENVLAYFNIKEVEGNIDKTIVEKYLVDSNWNHDDYLALHSRLET